MCSPGASNRSSHCCGGHMGSHRRRVEQVRAETKNAHNHMGLHAAGADWHIHSEIIDRDAFTVPAPRRAPRAPRE